MTRHGADLCAAGPHRLRATELDAADPLAGYRARFRIADPDLVYLDGNSLGRLPEAAAARGSDLVGQEWGDRLIRGWNEGWYHLAERIGGKIAQLVGADADEIIVADSTSVNLFKLTLAALQVQTGRTVVVSDELNFPSDLYVLAAAARLAGPAHRVQLVPSRDGLTVREEDLATEVGAETALLALSHTAFKSAFAYDLERVSRLAREAGALVLWDLSHSIGAMPLDLHAAGVDLAVGCCYKYLNGGPGAPAFLYVRRDLQERLQNPIAGWFGQADPFRFDLRYEPAPGIRRFLSGTPPVVSLALIEPGVDLLLEAGLEAVRDKSVRATQFLIELWEEALQPLGFELRSPRDPACRGSHVSLGHPEARGLARALVERFGVIPDFREPDHLRLGICPLYTRYEELYLAVTALRRAVEDQAYLGGPRSAREVVT